jgi:putative PIN family toxin of toxin-antitoxin system
VIRVVLDANVLVSAALARDPAPPSVRAFDALLDERIEAVGCPALLGEVAAVLGRERLRRYLSIEEARRFVADLAGVMTLAADPAPPHPAVCRDPGDDYLVALAVYQRIADEVLEHADRRAYQSASRILQRARAAAQAAGKLDAFAEYLTGVRERYRRRPTLIAILDKARLR